MIAILNKNHTFLSKFGQSQAGYTVSYQLLSQAGAITQAYTASGVFEIGAGEYGVNLNFAALTNGFIQWRAVKTGYTTLYATEELTVVEDFITDVSITRKIETGRWAIVGTQMLFYDDDGTTVLYTYNLKDEDGYPSISSIFERTPV